MYKQDKWSDDSMVTLHMFLNDGVGYKPYINYLNDQQRINISGNISWLQKQGELVTVEIDDYVYPDMPPFTTTIDNLLTILQEYQKLEDLEVDHIEISLDDDVLTIAGK